MSVYDCIIVGGGPAGLSAAVYLARFNRRVAVIDRGDGRTLTYELNENYLGFPQGIHARQFTELGRQQAERFGVEFITDSLTSARYSNQQFVLDGQTTYTSKTMIIATGVKDLYPNFPHYHDYLGKSLFWCITCDGYKSRNKKVVVVGDTDDAACTALQFLIYTTDIALVTNYEGGKDMLSEEWKQRLAEHNVPLHESTITDLRGDDGFIKELQLANGDSVASEYVFNLQGAVPNTFLATELGVDVDKNGYILVSPEQRTNVPFLFAAGDVTAAYSHQIATAVHEGSMAAQAANYDLYEDFQRM